MNKSSNNSSQYDYPVHRWLELLVNANLNQAEAERIVNSELKSKGHLCIVKVNRLVH